MDGWLQPAGQPKGHQANDTFDSFYLVRFFLFLAQSNRRYDELEDEQVSPADKLTDLSSDEWLTDALTGSGRGGSGGGRDDDDDESSVAKKVNSFSQFSWESKSYSLASWLSPVKWDEMGRKF